MKLESLTGGWVLQRALAGGLRSAPAVATVERGMLVIQTEGPGAMALVLRLDDSGAWLTGMASPGDGRAHVDVHVRIEEAGDRLVARPEGFADDERWTLVRPSARGHAPSSG